MKQPRQILGVVTIAVFALFYLVAATRPTQGYPPYVNTAKRLGFPAKDCTYCHRTLSGGSNNFNARGAWLIAEKKKRNADTIDLNWLKEYKPGKATTKARKRA